MGVGKKNIIDHTITLVYFMRGAIQYHDMLNTTFYERSRIDDFVNERLEFEFKKKKGANPIY